MLFPVKIAADRPEKIFEVCKVIPQFVGDSGDFLCFRNRVMSRGGDLLQKTVLMLHYSEHFRYLADLLPHVVYTIFHILQVLKHASILHADEKRNGRMFNRSPLRPRYALHSRNS